MGATRFMPDAGEMHSDGAFGAVERSLRQSLTARYGPQLGAEAVAAAMAWAWAHQERLATIDRPVAYLYRVGQSSLRPSLRWKRRMGGAFPPDVSGSDFGSAVDLGRVVALLPEKQRICVLLVHAHRWSYAEVAELLDISVEAVTNHVHRGLAKLRKLLNESD